MGTFCPHYLIVVLCHHTEKEGDGRESVGEGERETERDYWMIGSERGFTDG